MRTISYVIWLCILFLILDVGYAANILAIFLFPGASNLHFNAAILKTLHTAGHRVIFLTTFANKIKSSENFTVLDASGGIPNLVGVASAMEYSKYTVRERIHFLFKHEEVYCSEFMKLQVINDALSSKVKFDVVFTQFLFIPECMMKIAEVLKVPVIGTVAFKQELPTLEIGNPINPAVVPHALSSFSTRMSFVERLLNTWYYVLNQFLDDTTVHPKVTKFCRQYFPEQPGPPKISPSLVFVNSHLSLMPRAMIPNVIEIAGIHVRPAKPLSSVLKKFIDEAKHGVILFTFGSVVDPSKIPSEVIDAFVDVFASIPQRVIWKYDKTIENISGNVMLTDWIPQRDILEHENVIAFISHCGISGVIEAIHTGTPVVAAPLFADQPSNALLLQELGVAVYLPALSATRNQIRDALDTIVNDTSYYENMQKLSSRFMDRPLTPAESVVYWTDYVLRHKGASHMRTVAADMPLYQYLLLDVFSLVISVTAIILCGFYFVATHVCNFRLRPKPCIETQKKEN